jgi:hypothetical protein
VLYWDVLFFGIAEFPNLITLYVIIREIVDFENFVRRNYGIIDNLPTVGLNPVFLTKY